MVSSGAETDLHVITCGSMSLDEFQRLFLATVSHKRDPASKPRIRRFRYVENRQHSFVRLRQSCVCKETGRARSVANLGSQGCR